MDRSEFAQVFQDLRPRLVSYAKKNMAIRSVPEALAPRMLLLKHPCNYCEKSPKRKK